MRLQKKVLIYFIFVLGSSLLAPPKGKQLKDYKNSIHVGFASNVEPGVCWQRISDEEALDYQVALEVRGKYQPSWERSLASLQEKWDLFIGDKRRKIGFEVLLARLCGYCSDFVIPVRLETNVVLNQSSPERFCMVARAKACDERIKDLSPTGRVVAFTQLARTLADMQISCLAYEKGAATSGVQKKYYEEMRGYLQTAQELVSSVESVDELSAAVDGTVEAASIKNSVRQRKPKKKKGSSKGCAAVVVPGFVEHLDGSGVSDESVTIDESVVVEPAEPLLSVVLPRVDVADEEPEWRAARERFDGLMRSALAAEMQAPVEVDTADESLLIGSLLDDDND